MPTQLAAPRCGCRQLVNLANAKVYPCFSAQLWPDLFDETKDRALFLPPLAPWHLEGKESFPGSWECGLYVGGLAGCRVSSTKYVQFTIGA